MLPCSAYQNSVSWKLSKISCKMKTFNCYKEHSLCRWKQCCRIEKDIEVYRTMSIVSSFCRAGRLI
jgi:hypothetical protein